MKNIWKFRKYNNLSLAFKLQEVIPELKNVYHEDILDYIRTLRSDGVEFIQKEKVKTNFYWRLTLPFAFIFILLMFVVLPIKFIFTGKWHYDNDILWIKNWFEKLGF